MTLYGSINGHQLREMMLAGVSLLEKNKAAIDVLNVFPVPDGDTGTNMSLTMMSAAKELSAMDAPDVAAVAGAVARGALKGARGNSGVILSQLYRGFAKALEGQSEMDARSFARALSQGAEAGYKAVMKPREGTLLTVAREIAERATEFAEQGGDLYRLFENLLSWGEDVLARTPDMLPVLKKAGVVDAGGKGLLVIYAGYKMAIDGEDTAPILFDEAPADFVEMDDEEITFAYCTEYLIEKPKEGVTQKHLDHLREKLDRLGDCVLVVGDPSLIKVHAHSNDPGKVLQYGLVLGELSSIKIDNMRRQHRHIVVEEYEGEILSGAPIVDKEYGIVSVCSGEGMEALMRDLGATQIVTGGQTMNPSTDDILQAARRSGGKEVYILPNNPNIILAAQQAVEMAEGQNLHVLPTRSIPQGIAALIGFMPGRGAQENLEGMREGAAQIRSGAVTYAVRDSEMDGQTIGEGDIIGLYEKNIVAVGKQVGDVTRRLVADMADEDSELITLYFGAETAEEDVQSLAREIGEDHPDAEVEVVSGGQHLYYYLISVE